MHIKPRKRFGQHFLTDQGVIENILESFAPNPEDTIVEIGPGLGALTFPLLKRHPKLTAIEIDRDVIIELKKRTSDNEKFILIQQDVLTMDFRMLAGSKLLRIIGNLPYNISTPLLFHLAEQKSSVQDMLFMLQKEVVDRLVAKPDTKDYGRLSIMMQLDFVITPLFHVPATAFSPPPRVESTVVYFVPTDDNKYGKIHEKPLFSAIVRTAFSSRRKTIRNALKNYLTEAMLEACDINPGSRPAELTINNYVTLANYCHQLEK